MPRTIIWKHWLSGIINDVSNAWAIRVWGVDEKFVLKWNLTSILVFLFGKFLNMQENSRACPVASSQASRKHCSCELLWFPQSYGCLWLLRSKIPRYPLSSNLPHTTTLSLQNCNRWSPCLSPYLSLESSLFEVRDCVLFDFVAPASSSVEAQ